MIVYNGKKIKALNRQNAEIPCVVLSCRINETAITAWEKDCPKPGGAVMIPRRSRELPFGRNSFLFSYKRRYNGNLCARSVQQAKAASSMMTCTLLAPAAYFLATTVPYARNVSPTAYFLPTAAKSMKKCRQKPMVSALPSRLQELWSKSRRKRELICFCSRCRYPVS